VTTAAEVWLPLAAQLTPTNAADSAVAPALLAGVPQEARVVLGGRHYNAPPVRASCERHGRVLITAQYGRYPRTDAGVAVRRVFHKRRSASIEHFNGQFRALFDVRGAVPTTGLVNTQRFALGAVLVYHLTLWHRHEHNPDLRVGLDPFLNDA